MRDIPAFPRSLEEKHHAGAFERAFGPYGGRFAEPDRLAEWYRLRYWYYVTKFRQSPLHRPYLERFHFDLVADERLNAAATTYEDTHLIGVNVGTLRNFELFFGLLFSHPGVLPDVGQASRESAWIASLSGCDWRRSADAILDEISIRADPPPSFPVDEVRHLYSHRLAILAADFVFFHELGHLANGHIEYLHDRGRAAGVRELIWGELPADEAFDRQALEFNADAHATLVMTQGWFRGGEQLPPENAFDSVTEAVESLALAVIAVFVLFDPHPTRVRNYGRASHPHPAVRLFNVGLSAWQGVTRVDPHAGDRLNAAWLLGLQRAERACAAANVGSALWSAAASEMEAVSDEYRRIADHFQTINRSLRPDLRRFRE